MPVADDMKQFTSSTYAVFHALDELRQKYGMRLGQIVPVSLREIGEIAELTTQRVSVLVDELASDGWLQHEERRGLIQLRAVPQIKAVRQ